VIAARRQRDSSGHLVGYIDEHGLAWQSLTERIVAVQGERLAKAMALPYDDPAPRPAHRPGPRRSARRSDRRAHPGGRRSPLAQGSTPAL